MKRRISSIINYFKFIVYACRGTFGGNSPEVILNIIGKFVSLEAPFYFSSIVMNRDIHKSIELLNSLIASYKETKSEVTLDQIFTVLKEEFLKRDSKHGRKQL